LANKLIIKYSIHLQNLRKAIKQLKCSNLPSKEQRLLKENCDKIRPEFKQLRITIDQIINVNKYYVEHNLMTKMNPVFYLIKMNQLKQQVSTLIHYITQHNDHQEFRCEKQVEAMGEPRF